MEKLIIFADYGLDDAAATVSILKKAEKFEKIYFVPIGGNVPVTMSYKNCLLLLSHIGCDALEKIVIVDTTKIKQPSEYLAEIHGKDGMGDFFEEIECNLNVRYTDFEEFKNELDGSETVLSLGPMTLVKEIMEKHPHKLIIMGGCVNEEPNFKGYEFNHCLDKEAFSYCVKFPHKAITLDTCRTEKLDVRRVEIKGEDVHSRILKADQRLSITRGEAGCYVWDDVAACCLLYPERFEVKEEIDPYGNKISNTVYISDKLYWEE